MYVPYTRPGTEEVVELGSGSRSMLYPAHPMLLTVTGSLSRLLPGDLFHRTEDSVMQCSFHICVFSLHATEQKPKQVLSLALPHQGSRG